jgi:IS30 family transposase
MRPPWTEMDEDRIDLILTGIPKGSGSERVQEGGCENNTRKIRKTSKKIYRWIQEGRKSGIRGDHTEPHLQKESTPTKHRLQHRTRGIWHH